MVELYNTPTKLEQGYNIMFFIFLNEVKTPQKHSCESGVVCNTC